MKFSDLATIRRSTVNAVDFSASDIYIGYEHLEPGALRFSTDGKLDSVTSPKQRFSVGDTIYGRLRPYFRKVGWAATSSGLCSTDLWVFQPKAGVDPRFVFYVAASPAFTELANASSEGTRMPRASWSVVQNFEVPDFTLGEQKAVAATLGVLDDKIESSRKAARLLVDLAQAKLSHGGQQIRIGDVAELQKGVSYKGSGLVDFSGNGARPMFNLGTFNTTGTPKTDGLKYYNAEFKPSHVLRREDLLIANTDLTQQRELLGRGFLVPPKYAGAIHTHHTTAIRFPSDPNLGLVMWAQIQTAAFRERAKGFATGTTVAALPPAAILDYELQVPADVDTIAVEVRAMLERVWQLDEESARLATLRDTLLPELISGRIRVP